MSDTNLILGSIFHYRITVMFYFRLMIGLEQVEIPWLELECPIKTIYLFEKQK